MSSSIDNFAWPDVELIKNGEFGKTYEKYVHLPPEAPIMAHVAGYSCGCTMARVLNGGTLLYVKITTDPTPSRFAKGDLHIKKVVVRVLHEDKIERNLNLTITIRT